MFRLRDFLGSFLGMDKEKIVSEEIFCCHNDAEKTFLTNKLRESLDCYTYTIVTSGWVDIVSNGQEMRLNKDDFYTYAPGFSISIKQASADYHSICLLADEQATFDLPIVRHAIRAAYFPAVQLGEPKLHLTSEAASRMADRMNLVIAYLQGDHLFRTESLRMLYSLFLLDVMDIMERTLTHAIVSDRTENIFINFIRLLPDNFIEHHDVGFYADRLFITPTHLSRVIRKITGRTVVHYIDQMLLMEAVWLLQTTDLSIAAVAEQLHFADQSSFGRFFTRMKGIGPKAYRMKR